MVLDPHLFVKLAAWNQVEENLNFTQRYPHYLRLLLKKGMTYDFNIDREDDKEKEEIDEQENDEERLDKIDVMKKICFYIREKEENLQATDNIKILTEYHALQDTLKKLYEAEKDGNLTLHGKDLLRKHKVQKKVDIPLNGKDTVEFEKHHKTITNFISLNRDPRFIETRCTSTL